MAGFDSELTDILGHVCASCMPDHLLQAVMEDTAPSAAVIGTWGGAWERAAFLGRMGHIGLLKVPRLSLLIAFGLSSFPHAVRGFNHGACLACDSAPQAAEATARRRRPQRYLTTQLGLDEQQADGLVAFASFGIS